MTIRVLVADDPALETPLPQPRVDVLAKLVESEGFDNVLFGASVLAADVAALIRGQRAQVHARSAPARLRRGRVAVHQRRLRLADVVAQHHGLAETGLLLRLVRPAVPWPADP